MQPNQYGQYQQQPQYGQPPQGYGRQYAQPVQNVMPAPVWTPPAFSEPTGGGEGGSPLKIREIVGRICGVVPRKYLPETYKPDGTVKDSAKVVLDILVLDGPVPLEYGASNGYQDNPAGPPVYALDALPALITGVTVGNWQIVAKAKEVLDSAPGNTIPCRIVRGTQGQNPYFMAQIGGDLDPGTSPEEGARLRGMLGAAYAAVGTGRWPDGSPYVAPVPREINGGPRQKPTQQQPNGAAPVQSSYPPQPAYAPPPPAAQVQYPPAQPVAPVPEAPPGWNSGLWLSLTPEQRAGFLPTH